MIVYMSTTLLALVFLAASQEFNLPEGLLSAQCYVESTHNPRALHRDDGSENSVGICQVHLSTARWLGYRGTEEGLFDPKVNARYAAKYLRYQIDRYGDVTKAVAAYNAGSYRKNKAGEVANKRYVQKVYKAWSENR